MRFLRDEVENEKCIALAAENFGLAAGTGKEQKIKRYQREANKVATAAGLVN